MGTREIQEAIASIRDKLDGVERDGVRIRQELETSTRRLAALDQAIEALEDVHIPGPPGPTGPKGPSGPSGRRPRSAAATSDEAAVEASGEAKKASHSEEARNTNRRPRKRSLSSLRKMTVKDLRDELSSRGLPIEGTKAELIERLAETA